MAGSALTYVAGTVTIIVLIILWSGLNYGAQLAGNTLIQVANDSTATAKIGIAQQAFGGIIFVLILVIIIIMAREALMQPGDTQYG
jgi:hypothetical protein